MDDQGTKAVRAALLQISYRITCSVIDESVTS